MFAFPPEPPAPHRESIDSAERVRRARSHRRRPRRAPLILAAVAVATVTGSGAAAASWLGPSDLDRNLSAVRALAEPTTTPADANTTATDANTTAAADDQFATRDADPGPSPTRASRSDDRSAPAGTPTAASASAAERSASAEDQVLSLVNVARAAAGCRALTFDARLTKAARGHSADMAQRNYFAHDTPEGVGSGDRVTAAGYRWSLVGENIAAGQPSATEVMDDWMHSPGHRANILDCGYRNIGIGLVRDGNGRIYWTQDFGTLR